MDEDEVWGTRKPRNDYKPPEPPKRTKVTEVNPAKDTFTAKYTYDEIPSTEDLPPAGQAAAQTYYNSPYKVVEVGTHSLVNGVYAVMTTSGWQPVSTTLAPTTYVNFETDYKFSFDDLKGVAKGGKVSLPEAEKLVANGAVKLSTKEKIKYLLSKAEELEKAAGPNPTPGQVAQIKGYLAEMDALGLVLEQESWNQKK